MGTKIEWADATWNPITGCTPISEGCQNCYAKRMANRLAGRFGYPADDPFRVTLHPDRLNEPMHWRKPRRIFVCSMSDLFHPDVPDRFIQRVFNVMTHPFSSAAYHHTFMLLTKRPERILTGHAERFAEWPHIWLGVTAENQKRAEERIPILLKIPAAVRFVSVEPMIGPVTLTLRNAGMMLSRQGVSLDNWDTLSGTCGSIKTPRLDWVICGGETGPGARLMRPEWARGLRDQCVQRGVPIFFKKWGDGFYLGKRGRGFPMCALASQAGYDEAQPKGGRILDGQEWNEYPQCEVPRND